MTDDRHAAILRRLKSVEGHIRGIHRMVEEEAYCVDVVRQIHAAERALKKTTSAVLDRHLQTCVTRAIRGSDDEARDRVLGELLDVFEAAGRS